MKPCLPALLASLSLLMACSRQEDHGHEHEAAAAPGGHEAHGHGHGESSPSGASFKAGRGVTVTEETRTLLGLQVVDVEERKVPNLIRFTIQVFGEKHRHARNPDDHSGCDVQASGLLPAGRVASLRPGQPVQLIAGAGAPLPGIVMAVQKTTAGGESEVVIGVSNAATRFQPGQFLEAVVAQPRDEPVTAIPSAALLRTSEGTFVYAINGDAYYRTAVTTGAAADGWTEITDGLFAGDQVVTHPVETLWLIELRATKGGGHSH